MGTWNGQPFGNDLAVDWARELDDADSWDAVAGVLAEALEGDASDLDAEVAVIAIAAAEVVAHGLGRATQSDGQTVSVSVFVERMPTPPAGIADAGLRALDAATNPLGELAGLWVEEDPREWNTANARLRDALTVAE